MQLWIALDMFSFWYKKIKKSPCMSSNVQGEGEHHEDGLPSELQQLGQLEVVDPSNQRMQQRLIFQWGETQSQGTSNQKRTSSVQVSNRNVQEL